MTAYTPNLPALIAELPGDRTRAPQTEFTRARQAAFLEHLSLTGSVRAAASAAGVSHQSAYRARRACGALRTAWDGALVVARVHTADVLATRAIDGIEETVFYHGEAIATRTRYSDRLLLAHLARLDKLAEAAAPDAAPDAAHLRVAEDFDAALARFERGEDPVPPAAPASTASTEPAAPEPAPPPAAGPGGFSSPGPCNMRSMSNTAGPLLGEYDDELALEMARERPAGVPGYDQFADPLAAEECQREAFEVGDEEWWCFGEDFTLYARDAAGRWCPDPAADAGLFDDEGTEGERIGAEVKN